MIHMFIWLEYKDIFASFVPSEDLTSDVCGEKTWDICRGYVRDIKSATSYEELPQYPPVLEQEKQKVKTLTMKPSQSFNKRSNN